MGKSALWWVCSVCLVLQWGCAGPGLKGTPFYSDDARTRTAAGAPDIEPVNLLPFFYYRQPVLLVLWPLFEKTDNHLALRPLFSVYDFKNNEPVYNVLWPLARFDTRSGRHRVFPFFWGANYFTAFPLYWHKGRPFGAQGGRSSLIPLWNYWKDARGSDLHIVWPIFHVRNRTDRVGWRAWPLIGSYTKIADQSVYRFFLWPLGHYARTTATGETDMAFLPFFLSMRDRENTFFLSPLAAAHSRKNGDGWHGVLPLYFTARYGAERTFGSLLGGFRKKGDQLTWAALPLFSGGASDGQSGGVAVLGPLAGARWQPDGGSHHVFPLYYRSRNEQGSRFYSLPVSRWSNASGASTTLVPPLLSWLKSSKQRKDLWLAGPLARFSWGKRGGAHHVFPLYYRNAQSGTFLSPLWMAGRHADGASWKTVPLLFWRSGDAERGRTLTPLFSTGYARATDTRWHTVLPLYYRHRSAAGSLFVTPLGGFRTTDEGRGWLVYPLASWGSRDATSGHQWFLAPLFHRNWDAQGASHHLLPFYYWDNRDGTFVSPLTASWSNAQGERTTLVPPLLSWLKSSEKRKDLWLAGPLAHFSWGERAGAHHIFPLYYRDRRANTFLSLPVSRWRSRGSDVWLVPPVLGGATIGATERDIFALLGLFRNRWGHRAHPPSGHLLPLYLYRGKKEVYTPLFGWNRGRNDGFYYPLTPLFGVRTGNRAGSWLFPLYSYARHEEEDRTSLRMLWGGYSRTAQRISSGLFPLFGYRNERPKIKENGEKRPGLYGPSFWSLPACWYKNQTRIPYPGRGSQKGEFRIVRNGFFPLWSYARDENSATGEVDRRSSFLAYLYRRRSQTKPPTEDGAAARIHERSSLLGILWRRERTDDRVDVESFPYITYRREGEEYKRITFLYRFFRYERSPAGTKLNLFFIPVLRAKG